MYNYQTLQEVKESLYYYNEEQIGRDIQNYLFALNYEPGTTATCSYTGDRLEITDAFLAGIEEHLLDTDTSEGRRKEFRAETQREYTSRTLTQEMMLEGKPLTATKLFADLHKRYVHSLKEQVLEPFLKNANFRRALKDYGTEEFRTYDRRIRSDVTYLIANLCDKFELQRVVGARGLPLRAGPGPGGGVREVGAAGVRPQGPRLPGCRSRRSPGDAEPRP